MELHITLSPPDWPTYIWVILALITYFAIGITFTRIALKHEKFESPDEEINIRLLIMISWPLVAIILLTGFKP